MHGCCIKTRNPRWTFIYQACFFVKPRWDIACERRPRERHTHFTLFSPITKLLDGIGCPIVSWLMSFILRLCNGPCAETIVSYQLFMVPYRIGTLLLLLSMCRQDTQMTQRGGVSRKSTRKRARCVSSFVHRLSFKKNGSHCVWYHICCPDRHALQEQWSGRKEQMDD